MKKILLTFFCLLLLNSCSFFDHFIKLPYHFTCMVNGAYFQGSQPGAYNNSGGFHAYLANGIIFNLTSVASNNIWNISISLFDTVSKITDGVYMLNNRKTKNKFFDSVNGATFTDYNKSYNYIYSTDSNHTGFIKLKFDKSGATVSGNFYFVAKFANDSEMVQVAQGSFHIPCSF